MGTEFAESVIKNENKQRRATGNLTKHVLFSLKCDTKGTVGSLHISPGEPVCRLFVFVQLVKVVLFSKSSVCTKSLQQSII